LGICLGLQLLFEESEEFGRHAGMGVLGGRVERIPERYAAGGLKIPHMGWNRVARKRESVIWDGVPDGGYFYFVHSYWVREATLADRGLALSETVYGEPFVSGVRRGRLYAFQFHPEKSQAAGLRLLENFAGIARRGGES
ncbi:MAG: imidazole glycerol phosphate synthase subunit HisH, partial [Candidatus Methylomirabilis sp.]|nr:imidazole glycerol phosphate synthase subunit HisH [Deltaproteobacteria bacterium]